MMQQDNKPANPREAGDDALSNLTDERVTGTNPAEDMGYANEKRIAEDGEGRNMPEESGEKPSGSGITSKE